MKPKVLKTEAEHQEAMARIEKIFGAKAGTPAGNELELLTMLVEQFEREAFPIGLPDPISAIKFRMEQQGLKNKDLVPFIGSPSKVSEVLSGQRTLSLSMIRNLVKGLGIPAEVLIGQPGAQLKPEQEVAVLQKYPIAEMVKRGWFPGFTGTLAEARRQMEDLFIGFAGTLEREILRPAFNRRHVRDGGKQDDFALTAWRIRVMGLATKKKIPPYQKGLVTTNLLSRLAQLSYFDSGPKLVGEFLHKVGIHLVIERHLPGTHLDGAAMTLPDGSPLVALTLRYDRLDNFWFTLFHELAHVSLHLDKDEADVFFDDLSGPNLDKCEREADAFAQEALIPAKKWKAAGLKTRVTPSAVINFANQLRISPAIAAGRLQFELNDFKILKNLTGQGKVRGLFDDSQK